MRNVDETRENERERERVRARVRVSVTEGHVCMGENGRERDTRGIAESETSIILFAVYHCGGASLNCATYRGASFSFWYSRAAELGSIFTRLGVI